MLFQSSDPSTYTGGSQTPGDLMALLVFMGTYTDLAHTHTSGRRKRQGHISSHKHINIKLLKC